MGPFCHNISAARSRGDRFNRHRQWRAGRFFMCFAGGEGRFLRAFAIRDMCFAGGEEVTVTVGVVVPLNVGVVVQLHVGVVVQLHAGAVLPLV